MRIALCTLTMLGVSGLGVGCMTRVPHEWGTRHPMVVERIASGGSWLVACQARRDTDGDGLTKVEFFQHGEPHGDALHRYLFVRPGEGDPMDDLRAVSDDEQWLVIGEGQRLFALEVASGRRVELGLAPKGRVDAREIVFSPDATRVAVVAGDGLTLWDLGDGSKSTFSLGEGFFARPEFVSDELMLVQTSTTDDWRMVHTTLYAGSCRGPAASASFFSRSGEPPQSIAVELLTGKARKLGGRAYRVAGGYVVATSNRLIAWVRGVPVELTSDSCAPQVRYVDAPRATIIFQCEGDSRHKYRVKRLGGRELEFEKFISEPVSSESWPRLVRLSTLTQEESGVWYPTSWDVLDLERLEVIPLPGVALATHGGIAIVHNERERLLEWVDAESGARRRLPGLGPVDFLSGRLAGVAGSIIDFADGKVLGAYSLVEKPIGLSSDGRILVRVGEEGEGPLRWVQPLE